MDLSAFDSPSAISLTFSSSFSSSRKHKLVFDSVEKDYFLYLESLPCKYAAALSTPSNSILLLDKERLQPVVTFNAHDGLITSLRSTSSLPSGLGQQTLLSSGNDGLVKVWDDRIHAKSPMLQFEDRRPIQTFDVSMDGSCLATGTEYSDNEAHIIFWDIRSERQPTHINTSAHSDDISTIRFHSETPHILLSASTDGLLCTTDVRVVDEDESGIHVGNWGCSISNAGWVNTDISAGNGKNACIWAHSDMQTVSLWSNELDLVHDYGDIRKPRIEGSWESEYFIDATSRLESVSQLAPSSTGGLGLWMGSNDGKVALIFAQDAQSWKLERTLEGSHSDVVRCILWDPEHSVLVSGGEDSRLTTWSISAAITNGGTTNIDLEGESMQIDEGQVLQKKRGRETSPGMENGPMKEATRQRTR